MANAWFRCRMAALALRAILAGASVAQAAPPPAENFVRPPATQQVLMSPSGKRLAMVMAGDNGRMVLATLDLPPQGPAKVVGAVNNADVHRAGWVNDDRLVYEAYDEGLYISAGHAGTLAVNHDGSDSRPLIIWGAEQEVIGTRIKGKVLPYGWSMLQTLDDGSADVIVAQRTFSATGELVEVTLGRLNTLNGSLRTIGIGMPSRAIEWVFDAQGEPVVVRTNDGGRDRLHWREPGSTQWTVIEDHEETSDQVLKPLYLEGSGDLIVSTLAGRNTRGLYAYNLKKRKLDPEPLVVVDRYDTGNIESDPKARQVIGAHMLTDRPTSLWFTQRMAGVQKAVDGARPGRFNRLLCGRCESSAFYAVLSQSDRDPGEFLLYDPAQRTLRKIAEVRPWIDEIAQGRRSFHWVEARDGLPIPLAVTHPPGSSLDQPLPAVVLVHGGPSARGADLRWDAEAQFLATRGYRVIEPDFRGSTGYGQRHMRAGWKQWGQAMEDDLADAVRWAVGQKLVDPARVCIYGASYGGYAALMGPIRYPEMFRCAASFAGVTDIELMFSSARSDMTDDIRRYSAPVLIGDPKTDVEMLRAASPIRRVAEIKVPVLLAQGLRDKRVPREHANAFQTAARRAGVMVERIDYAEEAHGWSDPADHADFLRRLQAFLDRSLAR